GDITARLLAQFIEGRTGQKVLVENKPGANGIIGVETARTAPADGQTLLLATTSTHAANPSLFRRLPYDPERDFPIVGVFGSGGSYLLVKPDAPYRTLAEFIRFAKANPGGLNFGHFNASSQVPGHLLNNLAGTDIRPVPYKQIGAAMTDLIGGQIQVVFADTAAADTYVNSGQLRALAVTRPDRMARHPTLPTMAETWPDFVMTGFLGIAVPAGTPREAMQALNDLINDAIAADPMRAQLDSYGFTLRRTSIEEAAAQVRNERAKWRRYIALSKIEPQ
ncbi:MAG: tripartite tricarboxylate transporter substrate binding protein, partial [Burkholderiales bacterium]|nr:tripartite tricarboxylate transporter substrate binding protein [Burkholderiales bacterium]